MTQRVGITQKKKKRKKRKQNSAEGKRILPFEISDSKFDLVLSDSTILFDALRRSRSFLEGCMLLLGVAENLMGTLEEFSA